MDFVEIYQKIGLPGAALIFVCWGLVKICKWIEPLLTRLIESTISLITATRDAVGEIKLNLTQQTETLTSLQVATEVNGSKLTQIAAGVAQSAEALSNHSAWSRGAVQELGKQAKDVCKYNPEQDK